MLITLSVGSGTWAIARVLSLSLQGKDVPSTALPTWYFLSSIVASWLLWYRERKARLALEKPEYKPGPNVHVVSAAVIRSQFDGKKYVPYGSCFAAVCTLHNLPDSQELRDVQIRLEFRKRPTAESWVDINCGVWLNEERQGLPFKPGTSRDIVVAEWGFNQRVRAPKSSSGGLEKEDVTDTNASVSYDVQVTLYSGNQSFSQHFFVLTVKPETNTGLDRVEWSVKRD